MLDRRKYFLAEEWLSKPRIVCGLMSGTSLDGVDAALVKFWIEKGKHKFELLDFYYLPFDEAFKKNILNVINNNIKIKEVSNLNFELSKYYALAIDKLLKRTKIKNFKLDLIGMHGQTVWHEPPNPNKLKTPNSKLSTVNRQLSTTLQLGSAPALCNYMNIPVVSDFRSADVTLSGQGAPLVPVFDKEFLSEPKKNVIALNIGGIANITYLPIKGEVIAFDTGPGNVLIDAFAKILFNIDFDKNGKIGSTGKFSFPLFEKLINIDFISKTPPKSTGRELFNQKMIASLFRFINKNKIANEDVIFTLTKFTAWAISENIRLFANDAEKIIVSGGGAKNKTLMKLLKSELPKTEIAKSEEIGLNSNAKEAVCFAYLAWRNIANLPGNIISVTGAKREAILGSLTMP